MNLRPASRAPPLLRSRRSRACRLQPLRRGRSRLSTRTAFAGWLPPELHPPERDLDSNHPPVLETLSATWLLPPMGQCSCFADAWPRTGRHRCWADGRCGRPARRTRGRSGDSLSPASADRRRAHRRDGSTDLAGRASGKSPARYFQNRSARAVPTA